MSIGIEIPPKGGAKAVYRKELRNAEDLQRFMYKLEHRCGRNSREYKTMFLNFQLVCYLQDMEISTCRIIIDLAFNSKIKPNIERLDEDGVTQVIPLEAISLISRYKIRDVQRLIAKRVLGYWLEEEKKSNPSEELIELVKKVKADCAPYLMTA